MMCLIKCVRLVTILLYFVSIMSNIVLNLHSSDTVIVIICAGVPLCTKARSNDMHGRDLQAGIEDL